jgi:xanthine dehydrogenase small subunit
MGQGLEFVLNGERVSGEGADPHTTLLDFIRDRGFTGAKEGCAEGECGACTVVFVKPEGAEARYVPVNSCLVFLPMAAGQEILTVEALAGESGLAECQQRIADGGGSQCGYCTPGFVMSLFAEQYRRDRKGPGDPEALDGNLCRCTGYRPIRDAALGLGDVPQDRFRQRLSSAVPSPGSFASEGFQRPGPLEECLETLRQYPDARLIAGGTDLVVEANLRGRRFPHLISVECLPELRELRESEREIEIGAALTLSEIDVPHPVWQDWLRLFASPLIRNRATLGGNLATASPIGDGAPLLLALDARVRIAGRDGRREAALDELFLDYRKTLLRPGELLVSIVLPKPLPAAARFYKVAKRRKDDISTVAACFSIYQDGSVRLAYGGVAPTPLRARQAEQELGGIPWGAAAIGRAQAALGRTLKPISDHRGSAAYRLAVSQSLLEKFAFEQWEGAAA